MTQGIFLYFLDGIKFEEVKRETLAKNPFLAGPFFELIHSPKVFRERLVGGNVIRGPEGKGGCVVGIQPQVETDQGLGYLPDRQTWAKFGEQHIGYQTDMKPGPESLRRASLISGYDVELGDGQIWKAPVIRRFDEDVISWASTLPMAFALGGDMQMSMQPLEQYRELWQTSSKIWSAIFAGGDASGMDAIEWAIACLGLNYRVGSIEASILGILNTDTIREILNASVDGPMVTVAMNKGQAPENPT